MKFSVIIPCRNAAGTIAVQLDALAAQRSRWPWEVVVADNGSTDGTLAIVRRYAGRLPDLRVVDASGRRGAPHAVNVGVGQATGDAFLFCDADDEVAPGWLAAMTQALTEHRFVACRLESTKLNERWVLESRGTWQNARLPRLPYPPYLPHAGGGTIGIRRALFESVGGVDESLVALYDTFLCVRIQLAGETLHFVPDAIVHVRFRTRLRSIFRQGQFYGWYTTMMYKKLLALGVPKIPRPLRQGVREWRGLLDEIRTIDRKGTRARAAWKFGYRVGRLMGSVRHGVLAL